MRDLFTDTNTNQKPKQNKPTTNTGKKPYQGAQSGRNEKDVAKPQFKANQNKQNPNLTEGNYSNTTRTAKPEFKANNSKQNPDVVANSSKSR